MIEKHIFSSDDKLKYLGYGEWIEEPDYVEFIYKEMKCKIKRVFDYDPNGTHSFGGHLCGYVCIPQDHILYGTSYEDEINNDISVHGGLTYSRFDDERNYWLGFDCAHSHDVSPSLERLYQTDSDLIEIRKRFPSSEIYERSYKNIKYVMNECKHLVDQILDLSEITK